MKRNCKNSSYRQKIAEGLYKGIAKYVATSAPRERRQRGQQTLGAGFMGAPGMQLLGASIRPQNEPDYGTGSAFFKRVTQSLTASQSAAFDHAPAVVVADESDRRVVFSAFSVEGSTYFVDRSPPPLKIDIGEISVFADSGQSQQFSLRHRHADVLRRSGSSGNPVAQRIDSERRDHDVPARRGTKIRSADALEPVIQPCRRSTRYSGEV